MAWLFKRKNQAPALPTDQVVRIVAALFPAILDDRPDGMDGTLAAAGIAAPHRGVYVQRALDTLEVLLSKDEDKQNRDGMVAALAAKGIDAELAKALLDAAARTLLVRDQAASKPAA